MNGHDLPELFRGVRYLGAPLGDPQGLAMHDAWFRPLLRARAAAHAEHDSSRQAAHFAADRLAADYRQVIAEMALERHSAGSAAMRALEARLEEAATPMFLALQQLGVAEQVYRASPPQSEPAWSRWIEQLRATITAIDATFPDVNSVTAAVRPTP